MDARIVSWNLWWRFGGNWEQRQERILTRLEELRPDVVGLQEVWATDTVDQARVIADALGMHSAFAGPSLPPVPVPPERPDQAGVRLGVGLLSRWPIVDRRHHRLPSSHRPFQPVALLATLDHPAGPWHVGTTATEWEPAYADDHLAQTRRLADLTGDPALEGRLPVVLAADLNAGPDSVELRPLLQVMDDTWTAGGGDPDARTLRSEHPFAPVEATKQLDRRIDYVLARRPRPGGRVAVRRAFTLADPVDGLHPSDHDAVVVDLVLPD
jgi:endonuclease/exonuclease/phosphatase family metal-dependent hydrolase